MRRSIVILLYLLPFALSALIGPALVEARFHKLPIKYIYDILDSPFVYDLCSLIWPTYIFHLYDPENISEFLIYITVSFNILIYILAGLLAVALLEVPYGILSVYLLVLVLMSTIVLVGDSATQLWAAAPAFGAAGAIYAIPFLLLYLQTRSGKASAIAPER